MSLIDQILKAAQERAFKLAEAKLDEINVHQQAQANRARKTFSSWFGPETRVRTAFTLETYLRYATITEAEFSLVQS